MADWQCVTKARGLDARTGSELRIAVNGRARMRHPRLPEGYTGNAVLWARPATTAGDLVRRPLQEVVEVVSKAVADIDDAYFRSFIDFASSGVVEEEGLVPTYGGCVGDGAEPERRGGQPAGAPVPGLRLRRWAAVLRHAELLASGRRHIRRVVFLWRREH